MTIEERFELYQKAINKIDDKLEQVFFWYPNCSAGELRAMIYDILRELTNELQAKAKRND